MTKSTTDDVLQRLMDVVSSRQSEQVAAIFRQYITEVTGEEERIPATAITLEETISIFNLKYPPRISFSGGDLSMWAIEDEITSEFPVSSCFSNCIRVLSPYR